MAAPQLNSLNLTCFGSTQSETITGVADKVTTQQTPTEESPLDLWGSPHDHDPKRPVSSDDFEDIKFPVPPERSFSYSSSDEDTEINPTEFSKLEIGHTTTPHQGEDGNNKVLPPVASRAASSSQKSDGKPYNYCSILAVLQILCLYFADPNSAFNKWIDKLGLKEFTNLRTMSEPWDTDSINKDSVIRMFCSNKSPNDYYGNPFERFLELAEKDKLLEYQKSFPELNTSNIQHQTTGPILHNVINEMIREKLKKDKCPFEDAVSQVFTGHPPKVNGELRPYLPMKTSPFLPFQLYDVIEGSSQLPSTLKLKGEGGSTLTYKLAGMIFQRRDRKSGEKHYVVRGYDPVQQKWRYNTETDGDWEEDHGDPKSGEQYEYRLSTVMYIINDPPGSDPSSVDIYENPRFSQPIDETPGNMLPSSTH